MTDFPIVTIDQNRAVEEAQARRNIVIILRQRNILQQGVDYGVVPGTTKPTLLKPGAERLCAALGLNPRFDLMNKVERWDADAPLFHYQYMCRLIHIDSGHELATGIGSCNSMEDKYRWRWTDRVPAGLNADELETRNSTLFEFDFALNKAETSGKYGKPLAYWQRFKEAIENGAARRAQKQTARGMSDGWEIGGVVYRVPNDDVFSIVNTIDKMAQKRALIAAALIGANASEFFTQDVEDLPGFGGLVVDGEFSEVKRDELPAPSGTAWTADEAVEWARRNSRDDFNANHLKAALGIKERWSEWTGDSASASKRLGAWMEQQTASAR